MHIRIMDLTDDRSPLTPPASRAAVDTLLLLAMGAGVLLAARWIPDGTVWERLALPLRTALLLLPLTWLLRRSGQGWGAVGLRWPGRPWRAIGIVVAGYVLIATVATALLAVVFPAMGWPANTTAALGHLRGDTGEYLYWLLIAWSCAAVGEELIFRGFLLSRLESALGGGRAALLTALLVQALIFGLSHAYQGPGGMWLTGITGLLLGGVYLISGRNLVVCILLHGLVDSVSLTAIYLGAL
jgi:membrane protease YdiL (CAAX protease family)